MSLYPLLGEESKLFTANVIQYVSVCLPYVGVGYIYMRSTHLMCSNTVRKKVVKSFHMDQITKSFSTASIAVLFVNKI